jgi:hypothetical protein
MIECYKVFESLKKENEVNEGLFETINSVGITGEEFNNCKQIQLMAKEKACIFKIFD